MGNLSVFVKSTLKIRACKWLARLAIIVFFWLSISRMVGAQPIARWMPEQQIPEYHFQTQPPLMVVDANRTVHAFSSQRFDEENKSILAIVYNNWSLERGWSEPTDILISPNKNEARLTGVYLEKQTGIIHVTFFGGDGTEADIYYAKAPINEAGRAAAWSLPIVIGEGTGDPELADIIGDGSGNIVVVYSGIRQGRGLYTVFSEDGGKSWTDPQPMFLTYGDNFPVVFDSFPGDADVVHLVWDVRDRGGNGRQIYYSNLKVAEKRWEVPVLLSEVETGYGILNPVIVEYESELIVAYSGVVMQRSSDGGRNWTAPDKPFIHTGVNGVMSFVVDSSNGLHLLWAQRITGSPDIHGVWHSVWQNGRWSDPEAVVSGPQVADFTGDKAFDPFDVRAVVSQGNVILTTWRSDPGLRGNGIWFSYFILDSPELPIELPVTASLVTSIQNPEGTTPPDDFSTLTTPFYPDLRDMELEKSAGGSVFGSPMGFVLVGLVPVAFFLLVILSGKFYVIHSRR